MSTEEKNLGYELSDDKCAECEYPIKFKYEAREGGHGEYVATCGECGALNTRKA